MNSSHFQMLVSRPTGIESVFNLDSIIKHRLSLGITTNAT